MHLKVTKRKNIIISGVLVALFLSMSFHFLGASDDCLFCRSSSKQVNFINSSITCLIVVMLFLYFLTMLKQSLVIENIITHISTRAPPSDITNLGNLLNEA